MYWIETGISPSSCGGSGKQSAPAHDCVDSLDDRVEDFVLLALDNRAELEQLLFPPSVDLSRGADGVELGNHQEQVGVEE
jgi:hypothetical protein